MAFAPIHCPTGDGVAVVHYGKTSDGTPRLRCQHAQCECATCIRDAIYQGLVPEVKRKIVDMSLKGRGMRDMARVLPSSPSTVMNECKHRA